MAFRLREAKVAHIYLLGQGVGVGKKFGVLSLGILLRNILIPYTVHRVPILEFLFYLRGVALHLNLSDLLHPEPLT